MCIFSFFPVDLEKTFTHIFHITFNISDDCYQMPCPQSPISFPRLSFFFSLFIRTKTTSISVAFPHNDHFSSPFIIFIDHRRISWFPNLFRIWTSPELVYASPSASRGTLSVKAQDLGGLQTPLEMWC